MVFFRQRTAMIAVKKSSKTKLRFLIFFKNFLQKKFFQYVFESLLVATSFIHEPLNFLVEGNVRKDSKIGGL